MPGLETVNSNEKIKAPDSAKSAPGIETPEQVSAQLSDRANLMVLNSVKVVDRLTKAVTKTSGVSPDNALLTERERIEAEMRHVRSSLDLRVRPKDAEADIVLEGGDEEGTGEVTERRSEVVDKALETIGRLFASPETIPKEDREKLEAEASQTLVYLSERPGDAAEFLMAAPWKDKPMLRGITNQFYSKPGGGRQERIAFLESLFVSVGNRSPEMSAQVEGALEDARDDIVRDAAKRSIIEIPMLAKTDPVAAIQKWKDAKSNKYFDDRASEEVGNAIRDAIIDDFKKVFDDGGDVHALTGSIPEEFFDFSMVYSNKISALAESDPIAAIQRWNEARSNPQFEFRTSREARSAIQNGIKTRFEKIFDESGDLSAFEQSIPGEFYDAGEIYSGTWLRQSKQLSVEKPQYALSTKPRLESKLVYEALKRKFAGSSALTLQLAIGSLHSDRALMMTGEKLANDWPPEVVSKLIQDVERQGGRDSVLARFPVADIPKELPKDALIPMLRAYLAKKDVSSSLHVLTGLNGTEIDWQMLATREGQTVDSPVYEGVRQVRSADLQAKLWDIIVDRGSIQEKDPAIDDGERFGSVPPHLIGAIRATGWATDAVVDGLQKAYTEVSRMKRGGETLKNRLEFGITNTLFLMNKLHQQVDLVSLMGQFMRQGMDAETTAAVFDSLANQFSTQLALQELGVSAPQWMQTNKETTPWEFMRGQEEASVKNMQSLFGLDRLDSSSFERVLQEWGDMRPLIVIAGKYGKEFKEGMPLLKKTLESIFDSRWEDFRYDEADPIVARQLEGLGEGQKATWKKNREPRFIGDIQVGKVDSEQRRDQVRDQIASGLDNGHLVSYQNPETQTLSLGKTYEWATNSIRGTEGYSLADLQVAKAALGSRLFELTKLKSVASRVGMTEASLDANAFENRLKEEISSLESVPSRNAKQENALADYRTARRWAEERKSMGDAKVLEVSSRMGLGEGAKIKDVTEMRRALEDAETIIRIGSLSAEEIAANALMDESGELKRGELTGYLKRAEERFKDSAFAQDIQNVRVLLENAGAVSGKFAGLRIEESDHPKTLLESGKYPAGSGSCQNYEGSVKYNRALLAYVADADKKIVTVRSEDGTIVARAIVKLTYVDGKQPALFLEPTYTSVNKAGHDFDADFNRYLKEKAQEMGANVKVLRGSMSGPIQTEVRASRNGVQYEDGGAGGVNEAGLGLKEGQYSMGAYEVA